MRISVHAGDGAGFRQRSFPNPGSRPARALALCLLLALAAWAHPGHAGVYRCLGQGGETVFTGHPAGYTHCRAVSGAPASRAARRHARGGRVLKGAVYRVVHADGSVEYTNIEPRHGHGRRVTRLFTYIDTCAACALHSPVDWKTVPLHLTAYNQAVRAAAAEYGVKPAFLRAVIHAESAFDPDALSAKGAQGLMQLMPGTARDMGVADAFDAGQNIRGGARYLAQLLKDFHGDRELAAAAYNAGPQAVRKYDGVPPYAETRVYVKRVGTLYRRYAKALGGVKLADAGQPG